MGVTENEGVSVRRALPEDAQRLFDWRNDPVTRAMSRTVDPVAWDAHEMWFAETLKDPNRVLFIGLDHGAEFGMVRFDLTGPRHAEISINLDAQARGRRLATALLRAAIRAFRIDHVTDITALIRPGNAASIRAFEAAGFRMTGEKDGLAQFRHEMP